MAYQTLDSVNTTAGIHTLYTYANGVVPILTPMILFGLFLTTLMVSYFSQIRLRGTANLSASFTVSSFFVSVVATFMSFIDGFINPTTMITCYCITFLGFLWMFTTDRN